MEQYTFLNIMRERDHIGSGFCGKQPQTCDGTWSGAWRGGAWRVEGVCIYPGTKFSYEYVLLLRGVQHTPGLLYLGTYEYVLDLQL